MSSRSRTLALAVLASMLLASCCRSPLPCPKTPPQVIVRPPEPCLKVPPDLSVPRRWHRLTSADGCPEGLACYSDLDASIMADVLERAVVRVMSDWSLCGSTAAPAAGGPASSSPATAPSGTARSAAAHGGSGEPGPLAVPDRGEP